MNTQVARWRRWVEATVILLGLFTPLKMEAQSPIAAPVRREGAGEEHPIDRPLALMRQCKIRFAKVHDYSATLIRQEQVGRELMPVQTIEAKFRSQPFSVYYKWLEPEAGKEWIFQEGQNDDKVLSHATGFAKALTGTTRLEPESSVALKGTRHSIREAGIGNLIDRLITNWEFERRFRETEVEIKHMKLNGRPCFLVATVHPRPDDNKFTFHTVKVYIDKEEMLPVRIEAYAYPREGGAETGPLLESYTYLDLKINPGYSDYDFNVRNPAYHFSRF